MHSQWTEWGDAESKEEAIQKANMLRKDGYLVMIQPMTETEAKEGSQLLKEWDIAPWYKILVKDKPRR